MTEETNILRDWSVAAAAADFTPQRLKPRVGKTAFFERKKKLELQILHAYHDEKDNLISNKCVYNLESHLQSKFIS